MYHTMYKWYIITSHFPAHYTLPFVTISGLLTLTYTLTILKFFCIKAEYNHLYNVLYKIFIYVFMPRKYINLLVYEVTSRRNRLGVILYNIVHYLNSAINL